MANSGAHPNSASSSFPFERLAHYSEASCWPGSLRCLTQESCTCPIRNSRYLPTVLAGCRSSIQSALVLYAKRPFGGPQQVLSYLEQSRYLSPGEWGKLLGLDRLPE